MDAILANRTPDISNTSGAFHGRWKSDHNNFLWLKLSSQSALPSQHLYFTTYGRTALSLFSWIWNRVCYSCHIARPLQMTDLA
jgi:hypothetical protein